jgi:hypothetical protein
MDFDIHVRMHYKITTKLLLALVLTLALTNDIELQKTHGNRTWSLD